MMKIKNFAVVVFLAFWALFAATPELSAQDFPIPNVDINITEAKSPREVAVALQVLLLITLLSMAPAIILMLTSFTKIVIIFDFIKRALSLQNMPPNQVLVSLSLFLTFIIMAPVVSEINKNAFQPYMEGKIQASEFFDKSSTPLKSFMVKQIGNDGIKEVALFVKLSKVEKPKNFSEVPMQVLIPAFMLTEIKKAFIIGIYLFIPFLIVDMVVASTLMSMGMIMLPPVMISLPFKIILFVMIDGWSLLTYEIVRSYS